MKPRSDDIALVEGDNELNVQLVPLQAEFYMPSRITDYTVREIEILRIRYNEITLHCPITNIGGAPGTQTIRIYFYWNGTKFLDEYRTFTLQPGQTYTYNRVAHVMRGYRFTCKIYGDWEENNYSELVVN